MTDTQTWQQNGWACAADTFGDAPCKLLVWAGGDAASETYAALKTAAASAVAEDTCPPFVLAAFDADDWNTIFSPWPAPPLFKREGPFAGGAADTLRWMTGIFLPAVGERTGLTFTTQDSSLMGYSLAGLFTLWALCEGAPFAAGASCSGSLWYDGWLDYVAAHLPRHTRVYLSLGDREGKARNQRMAAVDAATRRTAALLRDAPEVPASTLAWHEGGHFDHVFDRLTDAMGWLLRG